MDKITLELTHDELLTLGIAMGYYTERWMKVRDNEIDNGEDAEVTQRILDKGFVLWDKIQAHY